MKLTESTLRKLRITEVERLDPIDVYLEDFGPGRGQLTLTCYGKSWTTTWSAMGKENDLATFVRKCDPDYIATRFDPNTTRERFSGEALAKLAKKTVCERRRGRGEGEPLDKDDARALYDRTSDLAGCERLDLCPGHLMEEVFGNEWWFAADRAVEPNPDYLYLCRIIQTVQEALAGAPPAATPETSTTEAAPRRARPR